MLYIVLFLHQTTTLKQDVLSAFSLYIVLFLHQTTTYKECSELLGSCISYYSYIKPQHVVHKGVSCLVVYRTIPTSNHNMNGKHVFLEMLYIVLFLHQTTTSSSCLYTQNVVVYRTIPTSNHNLYYSYE